MLSKIKNSRGKNNFEKFFLKVSLINHERPHLGVYYRNLSKENTRSRLEYEETVEATGSMGRKPTALMFDSEGIGNLD